MKSDELKTFIGKRPEEYKGGSIAIILDGTIEDFLKPSGDLMFSFIPVGLLNRAIREGNRLIINTKKEN